MSASPPSSTPSPPASSSPPPPSSSTSPPPPEALPPSNPSPPPPPTETPPPTSPPPPTETPPPTSPPPPTETPPPTSPPPPTKTPPPTSPPPPKETPPPTSPPPPKETPPPTSPPPPTETPPPTSPPPASPPPKSPPPVSPPPATPPPSSPPVAPSPPPPAATPPPNSRNPPPPDSSPPPPDASPPPPDASPPPPETSPPPDSPPDSPPPPVALTPPSPPGTGTPPSPILRLSPPPPAVQSPPPSPSPPASKSNTALAVGIAAGAVVGVVALLAVCCFLFYKRKSRKRETFRDNVESYYAIQPSPSPPYHVSNRSGPGSGTGSAGSGGIYPGPNYLPFAPSPAPPVIGGPNTYEDLSVATNGFSESNVLGQGGFGLVYKGTLNGKEVAIKKLRSGGGQGEREFRAEVDIISRVHHKNLVSLVGYCIHDEQRLLVYEYVPNKTLEFHLHGSGRPTLDWVRRWKIALGAAKGFAYLHEDCDPKIIHRDIKAANILLDYHFEPKVSDFGLAKFMPGDISHVSTRVMGTFGYVAPEYVQSGKLTDRSDVYSYGVMLLELITGKKPLMSTDVYNDITLVGWARPFLSKAVSEEVYDELVDPRLETNYDQYDMTRLIHCAAASVRHLARKRPRMSQIVRYLEGEISLEDLNAGVKPGESRAHGGVSSDQVGILRQMAFGGIFSEDLESEQSSEYNQTQSSSSHADTAEIEMRRLNQYSR